MYIKAIIVLKLKEDSTILNRGLHYELPYRIG